MQKVFRLTLTVEQADAVIKALDLYTRIGIGQLEEVVKLISRGEVPCVLHDHSILPRPDPRTIDQARAFMDSLKLAIGHHPNGSCGITNPGISITTKRAYEVEKVLSQAVANAKDPNPKFKGVHYDGLLLKLTDDVDPLAEAIDI
jgi:ribosomal protein L22